VFEQTFKNIDDILHKDAGCTSELDYTEQSSWLLFLKYLDAFESDRAAEAELEGRRYDHILAEAYRWERWAAPKNAEGRLDHNAALTGDDLRDFVDRQLFPYLAGFKQRASGPNTIEYKIGEVFGEIKNKIQSGYNLRDVIDLVDELRFRSQTEKHELSHLYEAKIKNMGNAGRNGGEYYTPRPLIRAMIRVLDPKIGERIYDGACGSAGFLCEAFEYLSRKATTTDDLATLQTRTFYYTTPGGGRERFGSPDTWQVNLVTSYRRKIGKRFLWTTQVNIDNAFNHYPLGTLPHNGSGFTVPANLAVTFYGQPRSYVWTNSLSF
jgi:type I restriction enzyme M protein